MSARRLARRVARARARARGLAVPPRPARGKERYDRDLLKDPVIRFVNTTSLLWVLLGLAVPFALGVAIGGSIAAGLTGLLWGGAVRVFVLHHVTYSINSLCHFYGRQRFRTDDQSRNLAWLSRASLGEAWHNNQPRLPHLRVPRAAPLSTRPLRTRDPPPRTHRPHLGRRANQPPERQADRAQA
jgi:hypothetical protein